MADLDRWIQDALDSWLSPEQGTGPEGDEGWRERTGYLHSPMKDAGRPSGPPATASVPGGGGAAGLRLACRKPIYASADRGE